MPIRSSRSAFAAAAVLVLASCADQKDSVFDPLHDPVPPRLDSFSVETAPDGSGGTFAYASWTASEPVRAVIEYGPVGTALSALPLHTYSLSREFATSGRVKLVGVEPATTYVYTVRMWDRALNERSMLMEASPQFTTGPVDTESLLLVAMIDVGWGDSIYLQAPDGTNVLIDAGHPLDADPVREFLLRHGVSRLDFAGLSHVHDDHIGGFSGDDFQNVNGLIADNGGGETRFPIGTFIDYQDKTLDNANVYGNLVSALGAAAASGSLDRWVMLRWGASSLTTDALQWGAGLSVDLLSAGKKPFLIPDFIAQEEAGSVINNDSMIYRVQYGSFVAILTGDAEFASEQFLQNHYSSDFLRCAVLKLGHHGSNDANSERHIEFVDPIVGLIPNAVSENPGVQHPFVLNRLRNRGIDYYASDRVIPNRDRALPGVRGDVLIWTDGTAFTIEIEGLRYE